LFDDVVTDAKRKINCDGTEDEVYRLTASALQKLLEKSQTKAMCQSGNKSSSYLTSV
jgi:hypothetical protein